MKHILDRPVWNALNTLQSEVSIGGKNARRFMEDIGPLASARDDSDDSLNELSELIPSDKTLILLQADPIVLPASIAAVSTASGVQMILKYFNPAPEKFNARIQLLDEKDIPEMHALATLTQPGPFEKCTPHLGEFWGIKENGVLLAMAGERMKHSGYTEISGVCTQPTARGRGLARTLTTTIATRIIERGEIPYLHTYATNTAAIRLYETLGFQLRCPMHVAVIASRNSQHAEP